MRPILFAAFVFICACSSAGAKSIIVIDIRTTPLVLRYWLNNEPKTSAEIPEWMKNCVEMFGDADPVLIRPDSSTTFSSVLMLLESLKAAGVKHFVLTPEEQAWSTSVNNRSLIVNADQNA